jgi:protein-tyrosine phosphatase
VVDLRAERDPGRATAWPDGVAVLVVPLEDHGAPSADELHFAGSIVAGLMGDGGTVLVHCHAGVERAPTVACAALVLQGWPLEEAYQRVVQARPSALPTDGQLAALTALALSA